MSDPSVVQPEVPLGTGDRWYLNDERDFLLRSIDDADREHAAGDLSSEDHSLLVERDRHRLLQVETELASLVPEEPGQERTPYSESMDPRRSADWRRVGIIAACFMIVAGVVILVDHALSPRLPGQASSGSITLPKAQLIEQQLDQATSLDNGGQIVPALKLYNEVLAEDPDDPQALAASGWIDWNYGTEGHSPTLAVTGRQLEEKAIRVAPSFYAGHLFLGLILYNEDHNATAAVAQFNKFLADHPATAIISAVTSAVQGAYVQAGVPVPPELATPAG
jgi:tetratricopeptide (TPR) repeat protein